MSSVCRAVLCVEVYGYVGMCVSVCARRIVCVWCVCLLYCGDGACVFVFAALEQKSDMDFKSTR